jgi:hypothetical protein
VALEIGRALHALTDLVISMEDGSLIEPHPAWYFHLCEAKEDLARWLYRDPTGEQRAAVHLRLAEEAGLLGELPAFSSALARAIP